MSLLLLNVTLRGVSNKHCLLPLFSFVKSICWFISSSFSSYTIIHQLLTKLSQYFQDAFSLLAYSDPWNGPVGAQLDPVQREPVCAALNSAILGKSCRCSA